MSSRDITRCVQKLQKLYPILYQKSKDIGIEIMLTCTSRSLDEQSALYAQGRDDLNTVNSKRKLANMTPITDSENKYKVTWTMNSKHIVSDARPLAEAFDIVIVKGKTAQWSMKTNVNSNDIPDYVEIANIGKSIGLKAGADFSSPDYPHFEV